MLRKAEILAVVWTLSICPAFAGQNVAPGAVEHSPAPPAPTTTAGQVPVPSSPNSDPTTFEQWASGRYRITASDVIELKFPFVPEFDQTLTVQPDGYVTLRGVGDLRVQSRSIPELRQLVEEAYTPILRDPVVTITLKEFEKPYFVAFGEVKTPGRVELRGVVTLTQGLAMAGGMTDSAKYSQVLLFRRYSEEMVEVKKIDVKKMMSHNLNEDYVLRPGDTIFVPKNAIAKISPYLPIAGMFVYLAPWLRY